MRKLTTVMILCDPSDPAVLLFQLCSIQISLIPKDRKFNDRVVLTAATETSSLPQRSLLIPPVKSVVSLYAAVLQEAKHSLFCLAVPYFTTEIGLCTPK